MYDEDDFNDVNGWLLLYVVLEFAQTGAFLEYLSRPSISYAEAGAPHPEWCLFNDSLLTSVVGVCVSLSAALIQHPQDEPMGCLSCWTRHCIFNFIVLAFGAYLHVFVIPGLSVEGVYPASNLARLVRILPTSRRVRNTLGRNLFANASTSQDLTASSEP